MDQSRSPTRVTPFSVCSKQYQLSAVQCSSTVQHQYCCTVCDIPFRPYLLPQVVYTLIFGFSVTKKKVQREDTRSDTLGRRACHPGNSRGHRRRGRGACRLLQLRPPELVSGRRGLHGMALWWDGRGGRVGGGGVTDHFGSCRCCFRHLINVCMCVLCDTSTPSQKCESTNASTAVSIHIHVNLCCAYAYLLFYFFASTRLLLQLHKFYDRSHTRFL